MNANLINRISSYLLWVPWVIYIVWELILLALRIKNPGVHTLSQEARSLASRGLATFAYAYSGMAAHWFINWKRIPWTGTAGAIAAVAWWLGVAIYLFFDAFYPQSSFWFRNPAIAAVIGFVGAWLLFPQNAVSIWK